MDVQVHHRLASGGPGIHADVVAVGRVLGVQCELELGDGSPDLLLLPRGGVEPGGDMASGDDEGVAGGHGVAVADGDDEVAAPDDAIVGQCAEGAGGFRHRSSVRHVV